MNKVKITWKLDMFGRVIFVCDANTDAIESVPALDDGFAAFKLRVAADKALAQQLPDEDDDNGFAEHKSQVWEDLAQTLNRMCGSLRSYAKKNNNIELFAQAKFTPSSLLKKRDSDAILAANKKLDLLNTHVASLANYNVTPANITAATALTAELAILNPKPTGQRTADKALRNQVNLRIKDTTALLKDELDALVLSLEVDYPLFVNQYFNARRIQKTGIHHEKPEEEIDEAKEAAKAKKLEKEEKQAEAEAASKLAAQESEGNPAADGGQPDTNGSHPPTDAPASGETTGETA